VTPQQGWSPAPHSPALPGHGSCRARPTCGPTAQPRPVPVPREVPDGRAGAAPSFPAPGQGRTGPGCWALPGWVSWGAPVAPAPQPQGAAGPHGTLAYRNAEEELQFSACKEWFLVVFAL